MNLKPFLLTCQTGATRHVRNVHVHYQLLRCVWDDLGKCDVSGTEKQFEWVIGCSSVGDLSI